MNARLTQIRVTNFRSIRGTVDVPLDAPVVLVHGPNGSGKTSLLSALELGLTGAVSSLKRFDTAYAENLVHYDTDQASVTVNAALSNFQNQPTHLTIKGGEIAGLPLLSMAQSRFFIERSLLAQATLSRLLEIYEQGDAQKTASPLTRFVNDLLGLDQLDALIEGLHPSRDKRRLTRSLPFYGETNDKLADLGEEVSRLTEVVDVTQYELAEKAAAVKEAIEPFGISAANELDEQCSQLGDSQAELREAVAKAALKRDIEATLSVERRLGGKLGGEPRVEAQSALRVHKDALETWATEKRPALEDALSEAARLFADLSPARSVGWRAALGEAVDELTQDLTKTRERLARDETARQELAECREMLTKAVAREAQLDESLEALAANSGEMAQALSELAPLVEDEICPICQRDFSEIGLTSLQTHLATHISTLSRAASRLHSVANERQSVRREVADHRKELARLGESVLADGAVTALRTRRANLTDTLRQMKENGEAAAEGDTLRRDVEAASDRLATLRRDEEVLIGVRRAAAKFAKELSLDPPDESEALSAVLEHCLAVVDQDLATAERRDQHRKRADDALKAHTMVKSRLGELKSKQRQATIEQNRVKEAIKTAEGLRKEISKLSDLAVEARTAVVREAFNESLNKIWNNLFIRLAPEEPFLPVFKLPEKGKGPVEARLTTRYLGDDRGGNPKAMLSAGNLNTAALTLFLSLHLSMKPLLPWLVIDDPVQSMDEIHIAQFAALLRTLSKQRERQVIIAVHERSLFEYLALELSPSFPGDKLITVDLSKDDEGKTLCETKHIIWDTERVFRVNADAAGPGRAAHA